MKKQFYTTLFMIVLFLQIPNSIFAIDTNAVKYYPLNVNDFFVYKYVWSGGGGSGQSYFKTSVVSDSVFNGHLYYLLVDSDNLFKRWHRIDSTSKSIMRYDSSNSCSKYYFEKLIDSLIIDSMKSNGALCNVNYKYIGIYPATYFNIYTNEKRYTQDYLPYIHQGHSYGKNLGAVYTFSQSNIGGSSVTMQGCIIKGIVYGDTTLPLIPIKQISNYVPEEYTLSQNYPNPFNPDTKIKFEIPYSNNRTRGVNVNLRIYNVNGKEIANIFKGNINPGIYEANWNASDYPSGMYIYRLEIYNPVNKRIFTNARKMILLK